MKITNYRWAEMLRGSYLYITHWVRVDKYAKTDKELHTGNYT